MPRHAVHLVPFDPCWATRFATERDRLAAALGPEVAIAHIGSTSIEGLAAKPIVDMLVGWRAEADEAVIAATLQALGYVEEGVRPGHRWLCWPAPERRATVVHLVPENGAVWTARTTFRDRLRAHPELARRYAGLKRTLAEAHADDLDAYTAAKFAFVSDVLAQGR
jgi:GrpB-like predicted nucleotidyltransferase (UPF0157 family)